VRAGIRHLSNVSYYKAPGNKPINPYVIPRGVEYVELVVAGKVRFRPDGMRREIEFGCGSMFWHIEGDSTIHLADPDYPYECLCLRFETSFSGRRRGRVHPRVSTWENKDDAVNFSNSMLHAFHSNTPDRRRTGEYAYSRISWEADLFSSRSHSLSMPASVEKLERFIDESYSGNIAVSDLAGAAGVSVPHLHSLSRRYLGRSPHDLLLDRRLAEARRLLLTGRTPIKEISSNCGFLNIETFYRAFSRKYRTTPALLRRENEPKRMLSRPATA